MWITDSRIMGKFTIFEIWKKKISMNFVAIIAIAVLTVALALVSYAYFLCRENLRREQKMNSVFYGLANVYLESAAHPETLGRRVREVLDSTIADRGTFGQVDSLMEASYPGFLKGLYSEYPWMTDQDRQLVALMCCGISPNAVSVIMGMDMNRLSKWKTQLAKKMGSPVRLSKFLNEKLLDYSVSL